MAIIRFGNDEWLDTAHIVKITRHAHTLSTGGEHEVYTLEMDNNSTIKLSGAKGDFVIANLGTILDGPDA